MPRNFINLELFTQTLYNNSNDSFYFVYAD